MNTSGGAGFASPPWPLPRRVAFGLVLSLGMLGGTALSYAFGVLAPFLLDDLHLSRAQIGVLSTCVFGVAVLLTLPAGPITDRLSGKKVFTTMIVVSGAAFVLVGAAQAFPGLVVAAILAGMVVSFSNPVTNKLVAQHLPVGRQGLVLGLKQSGVQLGAILTGSLLPVAALSIGWRWAMVVAGGAIVVAGLAAGYLVPKEQRAPRTSFDGWGIQSVGIEAPWVGWLAVYALLMGAGVGSVTLYLPLFAHENLSVPVSTAGLLVMTMGISGAIARTSWGWLAERWGNPSAAFVLFGAAATLGQLLVLSAGVTAMWLVWPGSVLLGMSAGAFMVVAMVTLVGGVGVGLAGRAAAMVQIAFYTGFVSTPIVIGYWADRDGNYQLGWMLTTVMFAGALVTALLWARRV